MPMHSFKQPPPPFKQQPPPFKQQPPPPLNYPPPLLLFRGGGGRGLSGEGSKTTPPPPLFKPPPSLFKQPPHPSPIGAVCFLKDQSLEYHKYHWVPSNGFGLFFLYLYFHDTAKNCQACTHFQRQCGYEWC